MNLGTQMRKENYKLFQSLKTEAKMGEINDNIYNN